MIGPLLSPLTGAAASLRARPEATPGFGLLEAGLLQAGLIDSQAYLADPAIALPGPEALANAPLERAVTLTVSRGDTLMKLLVEAGIERTEAHDAITALGGLFSPRDLKIGQEIRLTLADAVEQASEGRLVGFSLMPSVEEEVAVTRLGEEGFAAEAIARPLQRRFVSVTGTIESSLSLAAREAGVPPNVLLHAIRAFLLQRGLPARDSAR